MFQGDVVSYDEEASSYRVQYKDGDREDMDENELENWLCSSTKNNINSNRSDSEPLDASCDDAWSLWSLHGLRENEFVAKGLPPRLQKYRTCIGDFFLFMHERQSIWVRRNRSCDFPWSKNLILRKYFFCNIYRELDHGTRFFHAHILDLKDSRLRWTRKEWALQVLWSSYCYRQVNRVGSFVEAGFPNLQRMKKLKLTGNPFFTDAHQTTNYTGYEMYLKQATRNKAKLLRSIVDKILKAHELKDCKAALCKLPGVGSFFAWQILCDMQESRCLEFDDSFCELGPGAIRKFMVLVVTIVIIPFLSLRLFSFSFARWPVTYFSRQH